MNLVKIISTMVLLTALLCVAYAQDTGQEIGIGIGEPNFELTGQSGFQFLKIPMNARQAGMGGIITATSYGDASASFGNPSSIADVENFDVTFSHMQWFADLKYQTGAIVKNFGKFGAVGVHIVTLDYGEMQRTENVEILNDQGEGTLTYRVATDLGTVTANDFLIGVSYAKQLTDKLQVGGNLRYVTEKLDDARTNGFTIDIGTVYWTGFKSFRVSMVARNLGRDAEFLNYTNRIEIEPASVRMPVNFNFGAAFDLLEKDNTDPHLWTFAAEFIHPNDGPEKVNVGTEYSFNELLFLRGGYRFNYDEEGLTLGGGIKVHTGSNSVQFHYSYWDFGVLDSVNMFTVGIGF